MLAESDAFLICGHLLFPSKLAISDYKLNGQDGKSLWPHWRMIHNVVPRASCLSVLDSKCSM